MKLDLQICSYRNYLQGLLKRKNPNARLEDIEDCVQVSLIKAIRYSSKWKGDCSLKTWVSLITLRMYSDSFRKKYTVKESVINSTEDEYLFDNIVENDFSETLCEKEHLSKLINELFSDLKDNVHIETFKLNVIEEIDYKDIAIQLNIPLGTVKSRIFKAKKLLQEKYRLISDKYEETTV